MDEQFRFKVNLGGMIDILANHLYSGPSVFIRELLQNGTDAISARRRENAEYVGEIYIRLVEGESMEFTDTGTGLTEEEIHKFISIIGQSSKRDITSGAIVEDYIGRFGIGMLSCFMVADKITIRTRSIKEECAHEWCGKPDGTYTVTPIDEKREAGTTVILRSKKDCTEYFTAERVCELINYYGVLLPFPIYLEVNGEVGRLNSVTLPWEKKSGEVNHQEVLQFGQRMFGEEFLDYIPLHSERGNVSGVAYILPYRVQPTAKNRHRIFLKNMLLTESAESILPDWAIFVRCIINSTRLRPTASREDFYQDEALEEAREEIGECIAEYLTEQAKMRSDTFRKLMDIHQLAIKCMAVDDDELYRIFFDYFLFETTHGTMSGRALRTCGEDVTYTPNVDKFKQMSQVFFAQERLLVNAGYVYEKELLERAHLFWSVEFQQLADEEVINIFDELDAKEKKQAAALLAAAKRVLAPFKCKALVRSFMPHELPTFYVLSEKAKLYREIAESRARANEMFAQMLDTFAQELGGDGEAELYFNFENPLIKRLMSVKNPDTLENIIRVLYVQSLLIGGFPLHNNEMSVLNTSIIEMIEWGLGGND